MRWSSGARMVARLSVGAVLGALVWGALIEPRLIDEVDEQAYVPRLPSAWDGRRIAVIADLQVGMWGANISTIRRMVRRLVERRPAVLLIAGDFLYEPTEESGEPMEALEEIEPEIGREVDEQIDTVLELLAPVQQARVPILAVLGNHDYAMQKPDSLPLVWVAERLRSRLQNSGVQVLDNAAAPLRLPFQAPGDAPLFFVGIGSRYANNDHPLQALSGIPPEAARIVFMHHPWSFTAFPASTAPLAIAAHTHGAQVRIPFTDRWTWMNMTIDRRLPVSGWAAGYGRKGNRLYVNRGIGFSYVPIRINAVPELTVLTLRRPAE